MRYLLVRSENASPLAQYYTQVASVEGVSIFKNEQARPRLFSITAPEANIHQTFGGQLSLLDYSLSKVQSEEGDSPRTVLQTWWGCQDPIPKNYTLYIHYVDKAGEILAQDDHLLGIRFPHRRLPTSQWKCPGYFRDVSYVPSNLLKEGKLRVAFGVWIPETGERLSPSGELPIDQYGRARLEIEGAWGVKTSPEEVLFDEYGRMWIDSSEPSSYSETVRLLYYKGDRIGADVALKRDSVLVHSTNYVSGWRATVDDVPVPVFRVADFLQGVFVP